MFEKTVEQKVAQSFQQRFGSEFLIARSPGRVNIIGEHTDYNDGFVLPAAIDKMACVAAAKSDNKIIQLYAAAYNDNFETAVESVLPNGKVWTNYILGVVDQMQKRGYEVGGFNLVIDADVPPGSGMSSSAAVECATAFALNSLFDLNIAKQELAEISQKAEHTFVGVQCGIMDQFASVFGKTGNVIKLDCRSLEYEYIPLNLEGYKIVLVNSNVHHSLASSEYNTRRQQCEEGVSILRRSNPEILSLRDVDEQLVSQLKSVDETLYNRCSYVVEENKRLLAACADLQNGKIASLGERMFESHYGLSKKYEVSCEELDFLVEEARKNKDVVGSRMMGGGFGGCTINIVREEAIENFIETTSVAYEQAFSKSPTPYIAQTAEGSSLVMQEEKI